MCLRPVVLVTQFVRVGPAVVVAEFGGGYGGYGGSGDGGAGEFVGLGVMKGLMLVGGVVVGGYGCCGGDREFVCVESGRVLVGCLSVW